MIRFLLALFLAVTPTNYAHAAELINPVGFIGQSILGSTVGAPLTVDSNFGLVSGQSTTTFVKTTGAITTTSATDVTMTSITLTPPAGTWQVQFCTTFTHSANNATISYSVYAGGVQDAASEMKATPTVQGGVTPSLPSSPPSCTIGEEIVNGSQAIDIRWRTSGATATSTNRYMIITRIR